MEEDKIMKRWQQCYKELLVGIDVSNDKTQMKKCKKKGERKVNKKEIWNDCNKEILI